MERKPAPPPAYTLRTKKFIIGIIKIIKERKSKKAQRSVCVRSRIRVVRTFAGA